MQGQILRYNGVKTYKHIPINKNRFNITTVCLLKITKNKNLVYMIKKRMADA